MTDSSSSASQSQSQVRHMDALPVGTRLAEFEILSLLGVGGFGMVYKAFDHSLHRTVAIKEYMPATLAARAGDGALWARSSTDDPAYQAGLHSFVDEARMLAQFDHPSLVKVFRFWEAQNTAYMVMPLYRGMTLKQARTQMRAPPPEVWLRQVLWAVLDALRVLHGANTLHRDISPDNIFLQDVGPPVLLDLGASRHAINDRDRKHTAVLKVNYAPIEQYSDGENVEGNVEMEQGPWSDLYSLAAVVHGCLCNDAPLPATLRALRDRMVPFSRVAKTVRDQFGQEYSAPFVEAISQALKLQPEERPQGIDAFLALMAMKTAPAGLDHFDFRAGLGDLWVEPTDQPDLAVGASTVDLTGQGPVASPKDVSAFEASAPLKPSVAGTASPPPQPVEDPLHSEGADTVFLDRDSAFQESDGQPPPQPMAGAQAAYVQTATLESEWLRNQPAPAARRKSWLWMGAGAAGLAVAAMAWALRGQPPVSLPGPPAADSIITELKPQAPVPVMLPTAQSATEPVAAQQAASEPAVNVGPAPAFVASDDPRAAPKLPARTAKGLKPAKEASFPEASPVQDAGLVAPPPAPVLAPVPRKAAPPAPLCADSNVLTRSMCLRDECGKPANAGRPACTEFRKAMDPLERNQFAN